jgi:predicted alpha-1,2-mannosidase
MISRRRFNALGSAAFCAGLGGLYAPGSAMGLAEIEAQAESSESASQYVDIRIGTGGHGHCYPGATVPFGMVQLSPDTYNRGWDWCSGYNFSDDSIMGFSHTHLSGTGIGDMLDFLVMACTGRVKTEPGSRENSGEGYRSRFSHAEEHAVPGYYKVFLRDYKIQAELTATARVGMHRYTFPKNDKSYLIVDLAHGYDDSPAAVRWSSLAVIGNDTLIGGKSTARWANGRENYFAMKFSRPFDRIDVYVDGRIVHADSQGVHGESIKAALHYNTHASEAILVKTGISGVNAQGAMQNLTAEVPDWNFDGVRQRAAQLWEEDLSRVRIEGGTLKQKQIFYTSLYHSLLAPTLFDDVDGIYRGMDKANHKLTAGSHNFSTFSLWDTYRAVHPLLTVLQPERVPQIVNGLIRMAEQSPLGMPIWPLQGIETKCMTGYHSAPVIAEAIVKKFPGIDIQAAYAVMIKEATASDVRGLPLYRERKFIPCDLFPQSVSVTLDYCYDDWAVSQVAEAVGDAQMVKTLKERALGYRFLYDKDTGFMRPRLANGTWALPFAPNEMGHSSQWRDYAESNPWQGTFAVQHDPGGLAELMGGRDQLESKLDGIFNASSALPPDAPPDITGLVGQYAHGNEPSHHIAYLYLYTNAPYKAQARIHDLMETMYDNQPNGLAGNEDCGQMSAWYVISAMGFYAVDPVSGNYVFGTPLFDRVKIDVGQGRTFSIEAVRSQPGDTYIQSVTWNGTPDDKLWFTHEALKAGGEVQLHMGSAPNKSFGADPSAAPPSLSSQSVGL